MPPQILPMKDIRRFYPNRRILSGILRQPENVGCIFGIISKSGATAKTRTFTTLKVKQHKLTGKLKVFREDKLIHDEFEETQPADLVMCRNIGLLSLKKRHAFSHFIRRRDKPTDAARRLAIAAQEAKRLLDIENARYDREEAAAEAAASAGSGGKSGAQKDKEEQDLLLKMQEEEARIERELEASRIRESELAEEEARALREEEELAEEYDEFEGENAEEWEDVEGEGERKPQNPTESMQDAVGKMFAEKRGKGE